MIVDEWVNAKYEGGRHQVRVDMLAEIEQTQGLKAVGPSRVSEFSGRECITKRSVVPVFDQKEPPHRGALCCFYRENEIYTHSPLNT